MVIHKFESCARENNPASSDQGRAEVCLDLAWRVL
jgi:hypothetical protein